MNDDLNWRYATKKFDPLKKIPKQEFAELMETLRLSPSSYGLQPWKFWVVQDNSVRELLSREAFDNQKQVVDCSHFIVFSMKLDFNVGDVERHINRMAEVRKSSTESLARYRDFIAAGVQRAVAGKYIIPWMSRQIYIPLGQFLTVAALLKIDACPMEGNARRFNEILGLKEKGYWGLCVCAAGYRIETDIYATAPKVRFEKNEVIAFL